MKPPEEEALRKITSEWLRKADQDIQAAESLLSQDLALFYHVCFLSQQAAEKYIKSYLTWNRVEFPKTHNIRKLLKLVKTVNEELAEELLPAVVLSPYGVEIRYPGDAPEPDINEAREAVELARKVRDAIKDTLPTKFE